MSDLATASDADIDAPNGRALIVADPAAQAQMAEALRQIGYTGVATDEPYAAMLELAARPLAFRALVLSLSALYPRELMLIETVKRRYGHIEVVIADVDGRGATLAEAVRLGADALLAGDRLHRIAPAGRSGIESPQASQGASASEDGQDAILTPEELRALLQEP